MPAPIDHTGLAWLKYMAEKHKSPGFVDLNSPSDIVRSESCKSWILAMRREA